MLAFRYLRARRQEGFISVIAVFSLLGIALGVATLIVVTSVMNGFRQEMLGRILGLDGHATITGSETPIQDFDAVAQRLRGVNGVVGVDPVVQGQVMATANGVSAGVVVRGMRDADLAGGSLLPSSISAGELQRMGADGLAIGIRLAEKLHVKV